jgi:hypothetical protein
MRAAGDERACREGRPTASALHGLARELRCMQSMAGKSRERERKLAAMREQVDAAGGEWQEQLRGKDAAVTVAWLGDSRGGPSASGPSASRTGPT